MGRVVVVVVIVLAAVAGCASPDFGPGNFHKPRMTAEQRAKDFGNCFYGPYGIKPGDKSYGQAKYIHRTATDCMNGRGYLRRSCTKCPPSPYLTKGPAVDDREDSRRRVDQAMAAFDACLKRAVTKLMSVPNPPAIETVVEFALEMCKSEKTEAEVAAMEAGQHVSFRWRRHFPKSNASRIGDRFDKETAPNMARKHVRDAMLRRR